MAKIEKMHACRYAECSRTFQNVLECMQNVPEYSRTCKFMDLHAFRNILEHPGTFCMHSGTFCMLSGTFCMYSGTFCMHSRTFWNILHAFWNILEHSSYILEHFACILEHSASILEHSACILEHSGTFCMHSDQLTTDTHTLGLVGLRLRSQKYVVSIQLTMSLQRVSICDLFLILLFCTDWSLDTSLF